MRCPFCGHEETRVVNSRPDREGNSIRRRRECEACKGRFTTYEVREEVTPYVLKKDGRRQRFDRNKLTRSLEIATSKCQIASADLEAFVSSLEQDLQDQFRREIPSAEIGDRVMDFLKARDHVAYVRYASVYREFRDVDAFVHTVSHLRASGTEPAESPSSSREAASDEDEAPVPV